jgi:hypothetical protein
MQDYLFDFIGVGADLLIDYSCSKALVLLLSWFCVALKLITSK